MVVQANVVGRDLGSFVAEAQERIAADVDLPFWVLHSSRASDLAVSAAITHYEDLARHRELREAYVSWLEAEKIPHIDLHPAFAESDGLLYWKRNLHLSLDGHRLAAEKIAPFLEDMVAGKR